MKYQVKAKPKTMSGIWEYQEYLLIDLASEIDPIPIIRTVRTNDVMRQIFVIFLEVIIPMEGASAPAQHQYYPA
jgi:hypothetical protein